MAIGVCVSVLVVGVCGLACEPVQKRVHPISQRRIVTGRRSSITALLCMRMFLGRLKLMPDYGLGGMQK